LLFGLAVALLPNLPAQPTGYRPPPNYIAGGKADQAEGARILGEFHRAGLAGNYWLSVQLRVMPHQGAERTVTGELFGTRNEQGPLTRLILPGTGHARSWLIQGGPQPALWLADSATSAATQMIADDKLLEPIDGNQGTDLTPFDLQMPFLYWTDFVYEGLARVRGRPAHSFVLYPPPDLAARQPGLTGVRVQIDTQFEALVQAELLGAKGVATKTITILDLKKVGEQWIVESIDLRNNVTRDKTRFTVTAAALNLDLPAATFDPAHLAEAPAAVPPDKIVRF
jgi:hypothetical protein